MGFVRDIINLLISTQKSEAEFSIIERKMIRIREVIYSNSYGYDEKEEYLEEIVSNILAEHLDDLHEVVRKEYLLQRLWQRRAKQLHEINPSKRNAIKIIKRQERIRLLKNLLSNINEDEIFERKSASYSWI